MAKTRFFEAHGTGTSIGDPIEARAIGECFRSHRSLQEPLHVGAVKSNIGHLEGSSGFAGIIKAVIALEKGIIPPNANFEKLNPQIDAEFLHLKFPLKPTPWPSKGVRRVSVNSFGFGGTNCHVVLDDAYHYLDAKRINGHHFTSIEPQKPFLPMERPLAPSSGLERSRGSSKLYSPRLVVLSAADEGSLWRSVDHLAEHLKAGDMTMNEKYIDDLSWTLNTRRTALAWRSFAVLRSFDDLADLPNIISKPTNAATSKSRLGFAFTGQGSQWYAMGRDLLVYPVYKASLLRSQELVKALGGAGLLIEEFLRDTNNTRVNDPEFSQPLCTALQIALVDLYQSLGIVPSVVVGHSSGEIAAAYCAGLLSQASAIKVAYYRGLLSSRIVKTTTPQYSMASVGSPQGTVTAHMLDLQGQQPHEFDAANITISCINSPSSITVSGPRDQLDQLLVHLQKHNIFVRKLPVDLAYHSPQMHLIASDYLDCLQDLRARDITSKGEYWVQNMISQVRFSEAMTLCCCRSPKEQVVKKLDRSHREEIVTDAWVELGPHSALSGPIRDILRSLDRVSEITYDTALVRQSSASETFLGSVGRLYCQKVGIDLAKLTLFASSPSSTPTVLPNLPQYSFNHSNIHWDESHSSRRMLFREHATHDLLGTQVIDWNPVEPRWSFIIKVEDLPWIADHRINSSILYPAAGMLAAAIEAVKKNGRRHTLSGLRDPRRRFYCTIASDHIT
ncbi:MAG: hypothetical protein Q9226_008807 [Calogaya cf. arnoldii]